jgi:hypothetical protein
MDNDSLLHQLEELLEMLDIEIRCESLETDMFFSPGGLCRLGRRHVLFIHNRLTKQEKIQTLARAAARFDLSRTYLRPGLRDFLSRFQTEKKDIEK